jgi:hypothetical protein
MSILTAEKITNLYLYGQEVTPENIANVNIIRPENFTPVEVSVNGNEFMQSGPGRFASPALWEVVREFFNLNRGLPPGTYTEKAIRDTFGISVNDAVHTL